MRLVFLGSPADAVVPLRGLVDAGHNVALVITQPDRRRSRGGGHDPSPVGVARVYRDVAATFVLDDRDRAQAGAIEELGYRVILGDTVMRDGGRTLAEAVLRTTSRASWQP